MMPLDRSIVSALKLWQEVCHTMKTKKMHNFHVPLPDELYTQLRDEALRSNQPATELVRYAIKISLTGGGYPARAINPF